MKKTFISLVGILMLSLSSCVSTSLVSSWRDSETTIKAGQFNKILIVALMDDETSRRTTEDKMVSLLDGKGIASYNFPGADAKQVSQETIVENLKKNNFDAAIVMRLVDVDKDVNYTPGTYSTYPVYYRTFSGYYYRGWNTYYTPGHYNSTQTFSVETNFYSLTDDKLIWTGLTKSTDPSGLEKMTEEIATVIYKKMVGEGFIVE